jgi:hypothetical protein
MEKHLLSDEDVQRFLVNGFLVLKPKLPANLHKTIFDAATFLFNTKGEPGNNIYPDIPQLAEIYDAVEVRGALTSLLGIAVGCA